MHKAIEAVRNRFAAIGPNKEKVASGVALFTVGAIGGGVVGSHQNLGVARYAVGALRQAVDAHGKTVNAYAQAVDDYKSLSKDYQKLGKNFSQLADDYYVTVLNLEVSKARADGISLRDMRRILRTADWLMESRSRPVVRGKLTALYNDPTAPFATQEVRDELLNYLLRTAR